MEKRKVKVIVERGRGKRNFSCFATENVGNVALMGYGATAREAMDDIRNVADECRAYALSNGEIFPELDFEFQLDVGSFFDYFPLDITATAKYIGVNSSVLRQYVTSLRVPRKKQIQTINKGISRLVKELGAGLMITQPVAAYV